MENNANELKEDIEDLKSAVMGEAVLESTQRERRWRIAQRTKQCIIRCLTLVICCLVLAFAYFATNVYLEQQYALNAQYTQLYNLVNGADVKSEIQNSGDGQIINGDNNTGNTMGGGD